MSSVCHSILLLSSYHFRHNVFDFRFSHTQNLFAYFYEYTYLVCCTCFLSFARTSQFSHTHQVVYHFFFLHSLVRVCVCLFSSFLLPFRVYSLNSFDTCFSKTRLSCAQNSRSHRWWQREKFSRNEKNKNIRAPFSFNRSLHASACVAQK